VLATRNDADNSNPTASSEGARQLLSVFDIVHCSMLIV
jgi:hypothetical protein